MILFSRALLLLGFLFPLSLAAQSDGVIEQSFSIELMPHRGNRRITAGQGVNFAELERQDSLESGVGGFGVGLLYESRVDKIGFTTGVRYLETGYSIEEQPLGGGTDLRFSEEVRARYVSIPFELNFHQNITEKDRVSFMLGAAANLHLKTVRERTTFADGISQGTEIFPNAADVSFRSPVISFNAGIALDRKLSDRWAIKLQPVFQFFLQGNQQESAGQTNRNYYQLGLRVVVKRFF